jgi:sporulation protein YlmC with PRC-barrel domain
LANQLAVVGKNAIIQIGGTTVGMIQNVTANLSADSIKEYVCDGTGKPAILAQGNKSFKFTYKKLFVDSTNATSLLNGTPADVVLAPAGTSGGNTKVTLKNVVLLSNDISWDSKGVVAESGGGEGTDYVISTW